MLNKDVHLILEDLSAPKIQISDSTITKLTKGLFYLDHNFTLHKENLITPWAPVKMLHYLSKLNNSISTIGN